MSNHIIIIFVVIYYINSEYVSIHVGSLSLSLSLSLPRSRSKYMYV